jgi:pimeloyl-ACP methyl ester carboxylesterase
MQNARTRGIRKQISVEGRNSVYYDYPSNSQRQTVIVMVHGYRGNHRGLEAIAGALTEFRILIPDLPGFGESAGFSANHSVENYADWLRKFLKELALEDSAVLVGHSFGTLVVGEYAGGFKTKAVVLINPVSAPALSGPRALFTSLARFYYFVGSVLPERLGEWLLRSKTAVKIMSSVMAKTGSKPLRKWIHRQHLDNFSDFASVRVAVEGFRASISTNLSQLAASIAAPVLLIVSELDDITSIEQQRAAAKLYPNASLREIQDVGHLVHYEAPDKAADYIREFLGNQK